MAEEKSSWGPEQLVHVWANCDGDSVPKARWKNSVRRVWNLSWAWEWLYHFLLFLQHFVTFPAEAVAVPSAVELCVHSMHTVKTWEQGNIPPNN